MSREGLVINDFSGGLNNVIDPSLIAENEVSEIKNLVISRTGKLVSRSPMLKVGIYPTGTTTARALGYYRNEDAVVFLVVATNAKTWLYNLTANTWTEAWQYPAEDITTYFNRLYLINSTNGGGYWSKISGSYTFTAVTEMPKGNQIHFTKGRIYVSSRVVFGSTANTSTLRYSNLASVALATNLDQFPTENAIDINEGDGDQLLKIVEGNSELFLFRSNSTYRLSFSASADPSLGTLTVMSNTIGADSAQSVVEGDNYLAVLHAGTLYQFAGYNFYPFNPANKVQFQVKPSYAGLKQALSKVGQYLLVWHHGYMYCYDTEMDLWVEWESVTEAAHFIEAPRGTFLDSAAVPTAYGVPGQNHSTQGLLKLALEFTATSAEVIKCSITTRTYDLGQPSLFKRLFGWELLVVAVNYVEASINPIDAINVSLMTWNELDNYTWQQAQDNEITWLPFGSGIPVIVGGLPNTNPNPQVVKVSGKQTFKRAYFTIKFENDGTTATAPSRLDGIVLYLVNGRRIAMSRTA